MFDCLELNSKIAVAYKRKRIILQENFENKIWILRNQMKKKSYFFIFSKIIAEGNVKHF